MALTAAGGKVKWERNYPAWVEKCTLKHGGKYMYPSNERRADGDKWRVRIICPEHGEFWQSPEKHAFGRGCPACCGFGTDKVAGLVAMYPNFVWPVGLIVPHTKAALNLVCVEHGPFVASYNKISNGHKKGSRSPCPHCNRVFGGLMRRKSAARWVAEVSDIYDGRVTLDPSSIAVASEKARFVCAEHGEFWSILQDVRAGHACPKCGVSKRTEGLRSSAQDFELAARAVHGDTYVYDLSTYVDTKIPMAITCSKHGVFLQRPNNHVSNEAGCPACANSVSSGELSVREWLESSGIQVVSRDRAMLGGQEIDIYLPEHRLGIEYCGLYWHGENHKHSGYHKEKHSLARSKGVKLVTVFEDEWLDAGVRQKVMFRLLSLLGASPVTMARKVECRPITWGLAKEFLDLHHMQGAGLPAKVCYGLFAVEGLVAVSTWGKPRFDKVAEWELFRFSGAYSNRIAGGLGKMFAAFQRDHAPDSVMTYADLRWGSGGAYEKIGFALDGETAPGYFWCKGSARFSRYDFQKHKLSGVLKDFVPEDSEAENCHRNGYWRIFDCGHSRWLWKNERND